MRETIEHPDVLVDVTGLSRDIEETEGGGLEDRRRREEHRRRGRSTCARAFSPARPGDPGWRLRSDPQHGDGRRQSHAAHPLHLFLRRRRALQQTHAGRGCDARDGFNRNHAVLGASESCVATHPSDMCVALAALDAVVTVRGKNGSRDIPLIAFHRLPGDTPQVDTVLEPGELIIAVTLPPNGIAARSSYRKVRDRASYAFALVSVAAGLEMEGGHDQGRAHRSWAAWRISRGAPSARKPRFEAARRRRPPSAKPPKLSSPRLNPCATILSRSSSPRG